MVRALTIPESNCTYGRRRVGSPRPPKRLTRSPIHPDRSQPAQEGSRQDPPKVLFWFHFWKYKFRQKILLSEVEICRQKILILYLGMHSHSKQLQYDKRQVGCRPADEEP